LKKFIIEKTFNYISTKIGIQGFLRSLITNLKSDLKNSKWRIQDAAKI